MSRQLPPFPALRAFEAAARHLSFKAASEELCVSPSAISHQVKALEEFLEAPLFIRRPQSVELTLRGSEYLAMVSHLLDGLDTATRKIKSNAMGGRRF
jgi:LysR family glycine cleavage system transcriptional activator